MTAIACPSCKAFFDVSEVRVGIAIRCPKCQYLFTLSRRPTGPDISSKEGAGPPKEDVDGPEDGVEGHNDGAGSSEQFDVFISYAGDERKTAFQVLRTLKVCGLRCWIDQKNLIPGEDWQTGIVRGINASRMMVLILSRKANASKQVQKEVSLASIRGLTILPFRIEEVVPTDSMEFGLGSTHWLDGFTADGMIQFDSLPKSVKELLEPKKPSSPHVAPARKSSKPVIPFIRRARLVFARQARLLLVALAVSAMAYSDDVRVPAQTFNQRLSRAVQPYVDEQALAGAVMVVANKDKILCIDAVGWADVDSKKAMETNSLFWIDAQSVPFTAAALMILVDEGKVKLDIPIEKYLPEMASLQVKGKPDKGKPPVAPKPTVRQMLSHTSGMASLAVPNGMPLHDRVRGYATIPLEAEPGTKFIYSEAGIDIAACIVQEVSHMPFEEFLKQRLFGPLGMKDTTFSPSDEQLKRLARSYQPDKARTGLEKIPDDQLKYTGPKGTVRPASGLFSTATDLARFCQMILNKGEFEGKRYLSKDAVKQMSSKQTGNAIKDDYGLGWSTSGSVVTQRGVYSTRMTIDTYHGLITIWMVQQAGLPEDGGKAYKTFKEAADKEFKTR